MTIAMGATIAPAVNLAGLAVTSVGVTTSATGSIFGAFVAELQTSVVVTDNKGNGTYPIVGVRTLGFSNWSIYAIPNGAGGAGHTFTATTVGASPGVEIYPFEITGGVLVTPVDSISSPQWNSTAHSDATPFVSANIVTSNANCLLLALFSSFTNSGTETLSWNNSFSPYSADGSSSDFSGGVGFRVVSAAGTYNGSVTSSGGGTNQGAMAVVAFKAAGGAAAPLQPYTRQQFFFVDELIQT